MENIRKESAEQSGATVNPNKGLASRLKELEESVKVKDKVVETNELKKSFKFPRLWRRSANQSLNKKNRDLILVMYFNVKNEIEDLTLVPLYDGSMIIHNNKAYEFDPRALWTIKQGKKIYKVLAIKERDRRPVSNLDWDEIKKRGDSTDSDEILLKMFKRAQIEKAKKPMAGGWIIWVVIAAIIGVVIYLMTA